MKVLTFQNRYIDKENIYAFFFSDQHHVVHTLYYQKKMYRESKTNRRVFFKGKRIRKIKIGREVVRWDKWRERRASCHL